MRREGERNVVDKRLNLNGCSGEIPVVFSQQQNYKKTKTNKHTEKDMPSKWTKKDFSSCFFLFPVWSAQRVKAQSELNSKKLVSKGNCSHRSS